jgi:hypothetical protein
MKKDTIVQFVGFITTLEFDDFITRWDSFAKRFTKKNVKTTILELAGSKSRYKYLSQHQWPQEDFQPAFMEKKRSESFPEHTVKSVQFGGYNLFAQTSNGKAAGKGLVKVMAFISQNENDIDFYRNLDGFSSLTIYQAYYESCTYGYVIEYLAEEKNAAALVEQLKTRHGNEVAAYKDCPVPVAV